MSVPQQSNPTRSRKQSATKQTAEKPLAGKKAVATTTPTASTKLGLQYIKGIGPRRAEALQASGIESLEDLVGYFPRDYVDAREVVPLRRIRERLWEHVTVTGRITQIQQHTVKPPHRVTIVLKDDSGGTIQLVFFQFAEYVARQYEVGDELVATGYAGSFNGVPQIVHPLHLEKLTDQTGFAQGKMLPIYPLTSALKTARLNQFHLRQTIEKVLELKEATAALSEDLPQEVIERHQLTPREEAIRQIHHPDSPELLARARFRMKYEELFFLQLRLALERRKAGLLARTGIHYDVKHLLEIAEDPLGTYENKQGLLGALLASLPFRLTNAQHRVLKEIALDMQKQGEPAIPMHRLLQGDVGSGKTIVATLVMLTAIENGYQCALMAPTEILAEQHFNTLTEQLKDLPIKLALFLGGQSKKQRTAAIEAIQSGEAHIAIGTHALIEDYVSFDRLGLVIIDEQHRFGVAQRKKLIDKAQSLAVAPPSDQQTLVNQDLVTSPQAPPDVLIMTATPIPRTLGLTLYGDLEVSVINEYPKDRKPIITKLLYAKDHDKIYQAIHRAVKERGEQVYIVYPLVEKSEKLDLAAAVKAHEQLSTEVFTDINVGLLHGRMSAQEKHDVMMLFRDKKIDVLISTTVIEVGIDVPNASVMIIEHAERFGLAQLHQLRGRVGRGSIQSFCILVASDKMMPRQGLLETSAQIEERSTSRRRLETMVETNDGFRIAEVDLEIRGPGEFFGTKQSGLPVFQIADLVKDVEIMEMAREDAALLVKADPHLRESRHQATRYAFLQRYYQIENFMQIG